MATDADTVSSAGRARSEIGTPQRRPSMAAGAAVALAVLFIATSCWWLSRDRSIPIDDAGLHLGFAIDSYDALRAGHLLKALTNSVPYPPLTYLVGALGIFVGGVGVAPPIIALNLVFVLVLAISCYKVGRLAFGPLAGSLAVVFALGSPLVIEEFHEFMLDAPEASMVALAVWAILATERFSRPGVSALAGVAVGLGMLTKETFVFFVAGVAVASAVRGGREAWRGFAVFAAVVVAIAMPWYLYEFSAILALEHEALGSSSYLSRMPILPGIAPPRLSRVNFEWYLWSFLNWQLYLPLFAFWAVGSLWTIAEFARRHTVSSFAPELAFGALVAWAALTETYVHDFRYGIPMTVYLAVFGVGWIARLPRVARIVMVTALACVALANSLGVGFGVGGELLVGSRGKTYENRDMLTVYTNHGYWVGAPTRDGDMLGLLRSLSRAGVRKVRWYRADENTPGFSFSGITVLARIAGLQIASELLEPSDANRSDAFIAHGRDGPGLPKPCIELHRGAGVWVMRGGARGASAWSYCPLHPS